MNDKRTNQWFSSGWLHVLVSLLTLMTFAEAQSLYEMLAGNPVFLGLRLGSNWQLLEIVLVFNWLPALALLFLWGLLRRWHQGLGRVFLATVYFLLFLAFFLQIDNVYYLQHWRSLKFSYVLWTIPAALLCLAYLRFPKAFRTFLLVLSPGILIFPAIFLVRTWTDTQEFLPRADASGRQMVLADGQSDSPPIFLLIFDELTLYALLDDTGDIDGARFPHFRELAHQSHWFRNATANAEYTTQSVPIILTGNFPAKEKAPAYYIYPENLFALLYPYYDVHVYENASRFCVPRVFRCTNALHKDTGSRLDLVRDISYLYAERVLPGGTSNGFPDERRAWALVRDPRRLTEVHLHRFEEFMDSVASYDHQGPIFYFFHNGLPHSPYWISAEGQVREVSPFEFRPTLAGNEIAINSLVERYRAQIMYVDKQLGRFVEQLKHLGLYERSLLIVTSDHGVSYGLEAPGRSLKEVDGAVVNAELILTVPLFIKLPFQEEGVVSDADVQLIDIVPTVADVLDLEVPWQHVGRSVFAPSGKPRAKVAYNRQGKRFDLPADLGLAWREHALHTLPQKPAAAPAREKSSPFGVD